MKVITLEEHVSTASMQNATGIHPKNAPNEYLRKALTRLLDIGTACREAVGSAAAFAILDLGSSDERKTLVCLHSGQAQIESMKAEIRHETDPQILISAGSTLNGYSGLHETQCKGSQAEMVALGTELIKRPWQPIRR